jgi:hypothetical protein
MRYMPLLMVILRIINGKYCRHLIWIMMEMVNDVDGECCCWLIGIRSENERYG